MRIDINCDMGESYGQVKIGNDAAIMPFISSANIACGFHGGDPVVIERTICLALKYGVAVGAHPGYHDLEGFGRRPVNMSREELRSSLLYQVGALKSMTESLGGRLVHVKPHGAMYNLAAADYETARIICDTVKEIDSSLVLFCLAGSSMCEAAKDAGLAFASEIFADRAYNEDGSLMPRNLPGAVIHDPEIMLERALAMIGAWRRDTICIHGDNESAPGFVRMLHHELTVRGIKIERPC
jgi:UPF0271 protein